MIIIIIIVIIIIIIIITIFIGFSGSFVKPAIDTGEG